MKRKYAVFQSNQIFDYVVKAYGVLMCDSPDKILDGTYVRFNMCLFYDKCNNSVPKVTLEKTSGEPNRGPVNMNLEFTTCARNNHHVYLKHPLNLICISTQKIYDNTYTFIFCDDYCYYVYDMNANTIYTMAEVFGYDIEIGASITLEKIKLPQLDNEISIHDFAVLIHDKINEKYV